ncbi:MAG: sec-independent protein translocase protein TatA [Halieaceae bacterium]|jgi:sec-independent protein translocase protein TatA
MGIGGIGVWQLAIILMIVIMLFGSKRLSGFGADLGSAIRGFRKSVVGENDTLDSTVPELKPESPAKPW